MSYLFWKTYWKLTGWTIAGQTPYHIKKAVLIVGPHTSWKDLIVGLAARSVLRMKQIKFLGKKELFVGPMGLFFRWLGGTPVDRAAKKGMVNEVVQLFNAQHELLLALSPEGTRKRVERLRSGFYFIALHAEVPIIMIGLDFENRQVIISEPFHPTGNQELDFEKIFSFYASIKGRHPELGLQHFRVTMPVRAFAQ